MRDLLPLVGLAALAAAGLWAWLTRRARRTRTGPPRRPGRTSTRTGRRPTGRATAGPVTGVLPRPGEIWWADVPYEDGTGSKIRPCLVLRVHRSGADVLKITSQDKSNRGDHVEIPTSDWDPGAARNSFLDLTDPIRVGRTAFADRAGACDATLWRKVQKLHRVRGG